MNATRLPKRVQVIISRCRAGERLCYELRQSDTTYARHCWFEPSGRNAPTISAEEAIATGLLVPQMDALLPEQTQTFVARPE